CILRQPDVTLTELQVMLCNACDTEVSVSTIVRTLGREGYTMKMVTRTALERNEEDRAAYKALIAEHF
ncbi:hypothetical protein BC834DRAFT_788507, partial [Gloeopeniophorella convolvens]